MKLHVPTLIALFILHPSSFILAQGPLTPPGAPVPTMKTLSQIEPRTPISTSPFVITNSGSYYLTTNLTVPAFSSAITIQAEDVTLDLSGFTLFGNANSYGGIVISTNRATVFNGMIKNCPFGSGISADPFEGCRFENLTLSSNASGIFAGYGSIVKNCIVSGSVSGAGIICRSGNTISDNICQRNANGGIYLVGSGNRIDNNQLYSNLFYGIIAANVDASNNLVIHNSFKGGGLFINSGPNWSIGTVVNSSSIATNTHPHANFNMN